MERIPIFVFTGCTATGKTAAALSFAKDIGGEIVSIDSRQIYRHLNIGTGKDIPSDAFLLPNTVVVNFRKEECSVSPYSISDVPVWLYDSINPNQQCNIALYSLLARTVIQHIHERNKPVILVGGSGYYLSSVLMDIPTIQVPRNESLRQELNVLTVSDLQQRLIDINESVFTTMNGSDRCNPHRLIRKIEIAMYTGSSIQPSLHPASLYNATIVAFIATNESLKQRVTQRVDKRLKQGIISEIRELLKIGYSWDSPGLQTISYMEWKQYITSQHENVLTPSILTSVRNEWIRHEYLYAKRQLTWFRKIPDVHWISVDDSDWSDKLAAYQDAWYTMVKNDYKS